MADGGSGASAFPDRMEAIGKWDNDSDSITSVSLINNSSGSFASGSQLVVLGYDPDDSSGDSIWEELASVELTSSSSTISSGTISAKKYLYFECYVEGKSASSSATIQLNNDTASNYARRFVVDGGTERTETGGSAITMNTADANPTYFYGYMINTSSEDKLMIVNAENQNSAGAGTAPSRCEAVNKWVDSAQVTEIDVNISSGHTAGSGSILKVWGFD